MFIIRNRTLFLWLAVVIVITASVIVGVFGLKPGSDFTGGSLIEISYTSVPEKAVVESTLAPLGLGTPRIRRSDTNTTNGYLITVRDLSLEERTTVEAALTSLGEAGTIIRYTSIGPVIGAELRDKAVWAIGAVLLIIIIYVAFAFKGVGKPISSWVYGFMTVAVLGHDILVPVAAMSLLGYFMGAEVDILFITALLTILGYSVNDTIVIFDRVREKLIQNRTEHKTKIIELGGIERTEVEYTLTKPFDELVGRAVSETMTRSINTSLTVLLALLVLYFLGSAVTETFVLVLIVGVFAGAFSSIFIASPLLVVYALWQAKRQPITPPRK